MKCKLEKPQACFNCPYPDCTAYNNPTREETVMLNAFIPDRKVHRTDARRSRDRTDYFKQYYKDHKKEIRDYNARYYKQHKSLELPDISAWDIWGNGFYIDLDTRKEVKANGKGHKQSKRY